MLKLFKTLGTPKPETLSLPPPEVTPLMDFVQFMSDFRKQSDKARYKFIMLLLGELRMNEKKAIVNSLYFEMKSKDFQSLPSVSYEGN